MSTENVGDRIMSHPMNDKVFDFINDRWFEMSVDDFKDWLRTHRETDEIADRVYLGLDYLEEKWKQEKLDSYPYV
jgi:erythromycin esterase-like protein